MKSEFLQSSSPPTERQHIGTSAYRSTESVASDILRSRSTSQIADKFQLRKCFCLWRDTVCLWRGTVCLPAKPPSSARSIGSPPEPTAQNRLFTLRSPRAHRNVTTTMKSEFLQSSSPPTERQHIGTSAYRSTESVASDILRSRSTSQIADKFQLRK